MPYDPQAGHRRPRPAEEESAPVEALLGTAPRSPSPGSTTGGEPVTPSTNDDPPPSPSVTPAPADPPPDALLINTGVAGAVAGLLGLLLLRHFWRRHRSQRATTEEQ